MGTTKKLEDNTIAQGITNLTESGDIGNDNIIIIPTDCRMISVAGPTAIGSNQVTELVSRASNANGIDLHSIYTQVIQASLPGNIAQSLILAAASPPVDFNSKLNCFAIYRTFQDEKQSPQALGGFAPMNVTKIRLPPHWGIWQIVSVTGAVLARNNMRLSFKFR